MSSISWTGLILQNKESLSINCFLTIYAVNVPHQERRSLIINAPSITYSVCFTNITDIISFV